MALLIRVPILSDQGPTMMTTFHFNYFLKDPITKERIKPRWRLRFQHRTLGVEGDTNTKSVTLNILILLNRTLKNG